MKFVLSLAVLLFFGCSAKENIKYYLPSSKIKADTALKRATTISVDNVSYLAGDRIWYKKDGVFLPYKNSYLAKTPKEFIEAELRSINLDGKLSVFVVDAYQSYEGEKTTYLLTARAEIETVDGVKKYKIFTIAKSGFGVGAAEAVRGLEDSVAELLGQIKSELNGKNK